MQSPLVPWARAGRKFGVGCRAVIPQVLPVTSRLAVLVLGGSSSPVGLPKLFRVSPDIYYVFAWAFFFFSVKKIPWCCKGGVRRAVQRGRLPCVVPAASSPVPCCPGNVKTRRGSSPFQPFPWNCFPFPWVHPGWQEHGGRRDTFQWLLCSPVTEFTCCSLEPFAALTSDVSSMIYAPVWTLLYIRVGVLHSHLLSIFLCALSDGFADCISIVFISMQVFKQYLNYCFLKDKATQGLEFVLKLHQWI